MLSGRCRATRQSVWWYSCHPSSMRCATLLDPLIWLSRGVRASRPAHHTHNSLMAHVLTAPPRPHAGDNGSAARCQAGQLRRGGCSGRGGRRAAPAAGTTRCLRGRGCRGAVPAAGVAAPLERRLHWDGVRTSGTTTVLGNGADTSSWASSSAAKTMRPASMARSGSATQAARDI
jgi:hypothetical protein